MPAEFHDGPLILAFDTSTAVAGVGIGRGSRVLAEVHAAAPRAYDEGVLPRIHEALAAAGRRIGDVEVVACGRGPGSFTGLRIAFATAKGYAFALGVPMITVSSTAATALGARRCRSAVVAIDAKRGQVRLEAFAVEREGPEGVRSVRSIRSATLDVGDAPRWIAGSGLVPPIDVVGEAAEMLRDAIGAESEAVAMPPVTHPRGRDLVVLAALAFARGDLVDPDSAEPVYLRPPPISKPRTRRGAIRGARP